MDFQHYKIIRLLGEGGMGKVYLAEDTLLEKEVAVKVLSSELSNEAQFIERFKREAIIQSKLKHPRIVTLHNLLVSDGTYFMVMEYAEGITLQELIGKTGPIEETKAMNIFNQINTALKYAHSKNIIHRDIKPCNIMISDKYDVKIMDFGIAKLLGERNLTQTNTKVGSLYYMSPEQINTPKDVDYRSDLFSLGIVLFEMVTGKLPYDTDSDSDYKLMGEIMNTPIPNPRNYRQYISDETINVITSLTQKDRNKRTVNLTRNSPAVEKKSNERENTVILNTGNKTVILSDENKKMEIQRLSENIPVAPVISKSKYSQKSKLVKYSLLILFIIFIPFIILFIFKSDKKPIKNDKISTQIDNKSVPASQVTDIDGNVYKSITIGTQEWLSENLNVTRYRNGDIIPQVKDNEKWGKLTKGAWCYYDNDSINGKTYGKLYNWYAVNDPRGLAPAGWHIQSDTEWTTLKDFLGGDSLAGGSLKATSLWNRPNTGATNSSGFTAFPGGIRYPIGDFEWIVKFGSFWSSTEGDESNGWYHALSYSSSGVAPHLGSKERGFSVRCIRDKR